MASIKYFEDTVKLLLSSLRYLAAGDADAGDVSRWLYLTELAIDNLKRVLAVQNLPMACKRKFETTMGHFLSIRNKLVSSPKRGGDLQVAPSVSNDRPSVEWNDFQSAFKRRIKSGIITNLGHLDIVSFLEDAFTLFENKIKAALEEHGALKVNVELAAEYMIQKSDEVKYEVKYFNTKNATIFSTSNLVDWYKENVSQPIQTQMEEFLERDSGWSLRQILRLSVNVNKYNPMRGNSYIPLPEAIALKKACINIENTDDEECFKWAILSALHPASKNASRVSKYREFEDELNFTGIDFPVHPRQISKFERQNIVSINVYILTQHRGQLNCSPCHVTSARKEKHVNLLLIQDYYVDEDDKRQDEEEVEEEEDFNLPPPKFHYVWIKNLSRLVRNQLASTNRKIYICDRCLHFFHSEDKLKIHTIDCTQMNKCKIVLPREQEKILEFRNFSRKERVPCIIYADFECLLKPVQDERVYQEHQAYSIGFYVQCSYDDNLTGYKSYRQRENDIKTPAEWFVDNLKELSTKLEEKYKRPEPMSLSAAETESFQQAKSCHICNKQFIDGEKIVRDHCHLTGRYRGAAHARCNLNYQDSRFILVVFHNLSGYDAHFIVKEIATAADFKGNVFLIPENKERYISFVKFVTGSEISFRFVDSYRFMASSLEKLASYLSEYSITEREFMLDQYSPEQIHLLKRKGVYPYDYVSDFNKLEEAELPSKEGFYSKLTKSDITDGEYEHAQNVWTKFDIRSLGAYSDLYLKTDVLLLADVFENFRTTCLEAYGLDPAYYYTTAGLTWDAMLKHTRVELELLTDVDMLMFVERGIRGGISQCSNRYAKANNAYMNDEFDPQQETKYLMYFDVNNLYGWAMTQPLPYGGFKWVKAVENLDVSAMGVDDLYGYFLEVDLEYPDHLHDSHKDLPFSPEHSTAPGSREAKLMTTLHRKERYVLHYRALQQALSNGLVLSRVHRALCFKQRAWLKPYVELNTEKRKRAKNDFEKLFFKLLINAVYGKTMENERKRVDVKLVNKWHGRYGAEALIGKPNFHSSSIFEENLVTVQLARTEIKFSKPIYVELSVLDLSKILVYDFHYAYMRKQLGDACKLLYTDTDSLIYEVSRINVYDMMKRDLERFDTSDYEPNNQFGLPLANKKVLGVMKDECSGNIMKEFIGLRSKMYSVLVANQKPIKKAKGIKSFVVNTEINVEDYRRCLFDKECLHCEQNNITSRLHVVRTEKHQKVALSPHDDKRHLLANSTDTLPWGHWKIRECEKLWREGVTEKCSCLLEATVVEGGTLQKAVRAAELHISSSDELPRKRCRTEQ